MAKPASGRRLDRPPTHGGTANVISRVRFLAALVALPLLVNLSGCAAVAVSGAVGTASVANDRRTAGTQVDDQNIEFNVTDILYADSDLWNRSHVDATSFNGIVLLTGEAADESMRERIGSIAAGIPKVRVVHNELVVSAPSDVSVRSSDTWLTGKVKTTLLSEMTWDTAGRIKVVSDKSVVYLMGLVTSTEADSATELTRRIAGVQRVVRLFELID